MVASIAVLALALRLWDLRDVPFNIYPDEIMTGSVAERAYLSGPTPAPVFSTLWGDVELPALWFALVAGVLKLRGINLGVVRLPAAVFGAATVLPFYGLVRGVWGRIAAITGASIMAFSAANVQPHGAKQYYDAVLLDGVLFLPNARPAEPQADGLDARRPGRGSERAFLLRDAPVAIHSRSVRGVSARRTLASRTTLPGAIRMAGA